jgi:uncharacterized cupredoxin-like copper-binding protein
MTTLRLTGLAALSLAATLALSACGSSPQAPAPTTTAPEAGTSGEAAGTTATEAGGAAPAGAASTVETKTLDTFQFEPKAWTVSAGGDVTVELDNSTSTLEHSWVLMTKDSTLADAQALLNTATDKSQILFEMNVAPGQTASDSFTAPAEAGEYIVACHIPGHAAGGMIGTLTVQ